MSPSFCKLTEAFCASSIFTILSRPFATAVMSSVQAGWLFIVTMASTSPPDFSHFWTFFSSPSATARLMSSGSPRTILSALPFFFEAIISVGAIYDGLATGNKTRSAASSQTREMYHTCSTTASPPIAITATNTGHVYRHQSPPPRDAISICMRLDLRQSLSFTYISVVSVLFYIVKPSNY